MPLRIDLPAGGWRPRPYQRALWDYMESGGRGGKRAIAIWHRRAGKDELALHAAACSIWERPATYWHMLPEAAQARKAIWMAVNPHTGVRRIDEAFPAPLRETTRDQDMMIRFKNGATWQVVGSDNYNSLVGSPPWGVVLSEYALANPAAYAYLSPILRENGGWFLAITTPRGKNHAYRMVENGRRNSSWFAQVLSVDETGAFSPEALAEERADLIANFGRDMGAALYSQEYECSFDAAIIGAYYVTEMADAAKEGRIGVVPVDRTLPVHTAWDLGISDATAIWFWQATGREIRVVDYIADSGKDIQHYATLVRERGYTPGIDWVPHDAKVRELGSGRTRVEAMIRAGLRPRLVPDHKVDDGINAARMTLARCWFDAEKCEAGIEALKAYRRNWDDKLRRFDDRPLHDWASDPADAFRYLAMAWRELAPQAQTRQPGNLMVGPGNTATFDDVFKRQGPRGRWAA
jgi:phage terminase large subunit